MGFEGVLYRNAGSYDLPEWVEIDNVGDLNLGLEKGEGDVTIRRGKGWRWTRGALKEATIEFQMVWDADDAGLQAMKAAHDQRTPIELAVMDGPIDDPASEGLRATMEVLKFNRGEGKEDAMMVDVAIKPTRADHEPRWVRGNVDGGLLTTEEFDGVIDGGPLVDPEFAGAIDGGSFV
jgi:hypothetical protein